MKMEFIFDNKKLKEQSLTEEICLNRIREYFKSHDTDNSIVETHKGFFEGNDDQDDWNAFSYAATFSFSEWFRNTIKEHYWYVDEEDGNGEQKEDCIESYNRIMKIG